MRIENKLKEKKECLCKIIEQYGMINILILSTIILGVLILIDKFNIISLIISKFGIPLLICVIIVVILCFIKVNILSLYKLKVINDIDFYFLSIINALVIYDILLWFYFEKMIFGLKLIITTGFIILFTFFLIGRLSKLSNYKDIKKIHNQNSNVISLKDLYDNNIPENCDSILLDDEDISYDLLNRGVIINHIANTIIRCNTNKRFAMAIKGSWGSGKTTILNNVKKKLIEREEKNIIYIDDFEPWLYTDVTSLLSAFFDVVMKNIGFNFSISKLKSFKNNCLKMVSSASKISIENIFNDNIEVNNTMKTVINDYLTSNDKRIVLVLDNLERCTSENILLITRLINNIFDFNGMIYVLSYDEEVMKKQFEENMGIKYSYLEKIVQLEFNVPVINTFVLKDIVNKCISNYVNYFKMEIKEEDINSIVSILVDHVDNIRDLKRIINSTFYTFSDSINFLNKVDMILVEVIALKNYELWNEISVNEKYYVSEDIHVYNSNIGYDKNSLNVDFKRYYDDLFQKK